MKKYLYIAAIISVSALAILPGRIFAATFSIALDKDVFPVGGQFSATVKIDSEDAGVNAAQATISFSKDTVQVVSIDKNNSVFNFWLSEPSFNNTAGQVAFVGGSSSGFVGKALEAIKITFKIANAGASSLTFTDGAITASDGSGTNLLTSMKGVQFTATGEIGATTIPAVPPPTNAVPLPTQIKRAPAPAVTTPQKPLINVPLYPNSSKWSNISDNFLASWSMPNDVTDVATAINKEPSFEPYQSEGLFDNKYFKALDNGIWYLHIRFKNALGWSPAMHYKIMVDTAPPLPFDVKIDEGTSTDNPSPTMHFKTSDQPSGIDYYIVRADNQDVMRTIDDHVKLPLQAPGMHKILIQAHDRAGNVTEKRFDLQILPIESPSITMVGANTYLGEGQFPVAGTAPSGTVASVDLKSEKGEVIFKTNTTPDANGNWKLNLDLPNETGIYVVEVVARDARGAESLVVKSAGINVRVKPLFVFGGIEVTSAGLAFILLFILIGGFLAGYFLEKAAREQRARKAIIAERDIAVVFNLLRKDIDKMLEDYKDNALNESEIREIQFYLMRMRDNLDKVKPYIIKNVEEIQ